MIRCLQEARSNLSFECRAALFDQEQVRYLFLFPSSFLVLVRV